MIFNKKQTWVMISEGFTCVTVARLFLDFTSAALHESQFRIILLCLVLGSKILLVLEKMVCVCVCTDASCVCSQLSPYDNLLLCQPVSSPLPLR